MKKKFTVFASIAILCLVSGITKLHAQTIRYVSAGGTGGGSSWADASGDFQGMINASAVNDQVWVAKGTYYPTTTTSQVISFVMKEGVKIYGSFAGTENSLTSRTAVTIANNPSILSGDLDKNNVLDDANSYSVIVNNDNGLTAAAVLDGFTVSGGNNPFGSGSGMNNYNVNPTISNCTFSGNYAEQGAGMWNYYASPIISNCIFSGNGGSDNGAGLYNSNSKPVISNCAFYGNTLAGSSSVGGAMYNMQSTAIVSNCVFSGNNGYTGAGIANQGALVSLTNCSFIGNTASGSAGGIFNTGSSNATLLNCTFSGNSAPEYAGFYNAVASNAVMTNCIFWGDNSEIKNDDNANTTVDHSIVSGGYPGTGNLNIDPQFVHQPTFGSAAGADLRLQASSCAIDAGSNTGVSSGNSMDLAGNTRIYNNTVDIGAYEYQGKKQAYVPPVMTSNNGLNFDGTDDYVSLSLSDISQCTANLPALTNAITIEYWFKGSNIQSAVRFQDGGNYIVAGWNGAGSVANQFILSNDGGTTGTPVPVGAAATDGNWHHIAMTWQQNTANGFKSYLDGQLVAQRDAANTAMPVINTFSLGSNGGANEFMNGTLDEVRVWNVARSQADIQANMNADLVLPQTGLLMYYKFNHGTAGGGNTGINRLANSVNTSLYPGILNNFTLTGSTSNWVGGKTFQSIRYVKAGATGSGSSWADASGDFQAMINASDSGNQVWVAKGTYYPTNTTDRTISFTMKEGVKLYGGFAGTENGFASRTPATMANNPSILSGDIDKNNVLDNNNSELVIAASYLTAAAVLDGFTVSGGYYGGAGAGMKNNNANPTISNCTFSGNTADDGAGIYNNFSNPMISNCTFSNNLSLIYGAGMYNLYRIR